MNHTVNIAIATNIVIADDQGQPVSAYIFPLTLLFFYVPDLVYRQLAGFDCRAYARSWRDDIAFMWLATKVLFKARRRTPGRAGR